ncbi:hypothetical protein JHK84_027305 [Glycine max]|nr:hypothetical protein JHK84_027305 [Glycine max]
MQIWLGKPVHFGLAKVFREVRAHIIISPDGDGVLISMNFLTALMDLFKNSSTRIYEEISIPNQLCARKNYITAPVKCWKGNRVDAIAARARLRSRGEESAATSQSRLEDSTMLL